MSWQCTSYGEKQRQTHIERLYYQIRGVKGPCDALSPHTPTHVIFSYSFKSFSPNYIGTVLAYHPASIPNDPWHEGQ